MSAAATPAEPEKTPAEPLCRTALHEFHLARGARMVPFAGYDMPVQYTAGVLKEHLWTRSSAGLFDVSHMGQVIIRGKTGRLADAALALERLVPVDVVGLAEGRQRYALFTSPAGGLRDDLMVANRGDHLLLVVNAGCKEADAAHLASNLADDCLVEPRFERALIALQGPKAEAALAALAPEVATMRFMDVREVTILGVHCIVSRSGYTGEDGYEIGLAAEHVTGLAERLLADPAVQPIGLGARDSLRLEAGLCLYGNDIDETTSPIEAALEWAIQKVRRPGGARAGGYPGADRIARELADGPARRRVGLKPEGRAPVRGGAALFAAETAVEPVGTVTSGGFGPTINGPVAMGYVEARNVKIGTRLFAEVRDQRLPVTVASLPFVPPSYKRG